MANNGNALFQFSKSVSGIEAAADGLGDMQRELGSVERLQKEAQAMHQRVVRKLLPEIHAALAANFAQSQIGTLSDPKDYAQTGTLERLSVEQVKVIATAKGILVQMPSGFPSKEYKIFGALNYGAVRNSATKGKARKKLKQTMNKVKNATGQKGAGGVSVIPARPFFYLSPSQVRDLNDSYIEYFQDEISAFLGAK